MGSVQRILKTIKLWKMLELIVVCGLTEAELLRLLFEGHSVLLGEITEDL